MYCYHKSYNGGIFEQLVWTAYSISFWIIQIINKYK